MVDFGFDKDTFDELLVYFFQTLARNICPRIEIKANVDT